MKKYFKNITADLSSGILFVDKSKLEQLLNIKVSDISRIEPIKISTALLKYIHFT